MRNFIIALAAVLFMSSNAFSEEASDQSIRELMQTTGAGNLGVQMMNQMLPSLKQLVPEVPDQFWQDFLNEVNADDLISMTIPIYKKYLTQEDVDALNTFYRSPTGKKMIQVQPMILQESVGVGQAWGQQLAKQVVERYKAKNP